MGRWTDFGARSRLLGPLDPPVFCRMPMAGVPPRGLIVGEPIQLSRLLVRVKCGRVDIGFLPMFLPMRHSAPSIRDLLPILSEDFGRLTRQLSQRTDSDSHVAVLLNYGVNKGLWPGEW
jgi:hypothetical protein